MMVLAWIAPGRAAGEERELWSLWNRHMADPANHADLVAACRSYAQELPQDSFLPVVRSLEAWHLLADGKHVEAARIFSTQLEKGGTPVEQAARHLARSWVTRIQHDLWVNALQSYYRKEVRYPDRLEEVTAHPRLPGADKLPLKDAWGRSWRYLPASFNGVEGFRGQKYTLECGSMPPPLTVADALKLPYAEGIQIQAKPVAGGAPGKSAVKLEILEGPGQGKTALGQVGQTVEGITVAHAGSNLVVLNDNLHWRIVTWTR